MDRDSCEVGRAVGGSWRVLLKAEHKDIRRLFKQFQQAGATAAVTKGKIVDGILEALTVHTYIENECLYPEVRRLPGLDADVLESYEEHHVADVLCMELAALKPDDDHFDAKTTVLIEKSADVRYRPNEIGGRPSVTC